MIVVMVVTDGSDSGDGSDITAGSYGDSSCGGGDTHKSSWPGSCRFYFLHL